MSKNGHPHKSVIAEFVALLEDQMDLASLEWRYERKHHLRRLVAFLCAGLLGTAAFVFIQVGIVTGIAALGLPVWGACLVLAGAYLAIAGLLLWKFARRDPKVGTPFQGTRQEFRKNLKWIEQLFS